MRDGCLESVETIVERQYGVLAERNCESLLFGAEHRRVRCLRPHRGIIDEVALLPLCYRLRVEVVASGELFDRSLRSLYRSSDDVSGLGAAVKYLSHRASRNVGSDCLIPRHSGTTHLGRELINGRPNAGADAPTNVRYRGQSGHRVGLSACPLMTQSKHRT